MLSGENLAPSRNSPDLSKVSETFYFLLFLIKIKKDEKRLSDAYPPFVFFYPNWPELGVYSSGKTILA
jgi:hypothetical protein